MQILVLLGMYFDAVVVFVTSQTLLFRLALAILWLGFLKSLEKCRVIQLNSLCNWILLPKIDPSSGLRCTP